MKDLLHTTARVSCPSLFEGIKELTGFDYSPDGTKVSWKGMPEGIPHTDIGNLFVHEVLKREVPAPGKPTLDPRDAEIARLRAELAAKSTETASTDAAPAKPETRNPKPAAPKPEPAGAAAGDKANPKPETRNP